MNQRKIIKKITEDLVQAFKTSAKENLSNDMMLEELIDLSVLICSQFVSHLMFSLNDIYPKRLNMPAIYCMIHAALLEKLTLHGGKKSEATRLIRQKFRRKISETKALEQKTRHQCSDIAGVSKNRDATTK